MANDERVLTRRIAPKPDFSGYTEVIPVQGRLDLRKDLKPGDILRLVAENGFNGQLAEVNLLARFIPRHGNRTKKNETFYLKEDPDNPFGFFRLRDGIDIISLPRSMINWRTGESFDPFVEAAYTGKFIDSDHEGRHILENPCTYIISDQDMDWAFRAGMLNGTPLIAAIHNIRDISVLSKPKQGSEPERINT